jgi:hypothetical protein
MTKLWPSLLGVAQVVQPKTFCVGTALASRCSELGDSDQAVKTVIRSVEVSQAAVGRYLPRRLKILDLA